MLFGAALGAGLEWRAAVAALNTALSLCYYVVVIARMYLDAPPAEAGTVRADRPPGLAIGLCLAATLVFGLFPAALVALGERGVEILAAGPTARAGAGLVPGSIP